MPRQTARPRTALTARERRFVEEYLVDLNARQAMRRAGYAPSTNQTEVMNRPPVAAAIEEGIAARRRRTLLTADRVLQEYARIAFADIRRIADFGSGHLKVRDHGEMSDDDAAAIAQVTPAPGGKGVRVKLYDKKAALDAIARHLGLFARPNAHQQLHGMPPLGDARLAAQDARAILRERLARLAGEAEDAGDAPDGNGSAPGNGSDGAG